MKRQLHVFTAVLAVLTSVLSLTSCEKDKKEPDSLNVNGIEKELTVGYEASEIKFTITSTLAWSVNKIDMAWATITPVSGKANSTTEVKVKFAENEDEARQGTITVTAGDLEQTITIKQQEAPFKASVLVTGATEGVLSFECNATEPQLLSVDANIEWTAAKTNLDWATVTPVEGEIGVTQVSVSVEQNTGAEREGTITFTGGDSQKVITVKQAKLAPTMTVTGATEGLVTFIDIPTEAVKLSVNSNVAWSVATSEAAWLTVDPKSGEAGTTEVSLTAATNTGEARQATVTFSAEGVTDYVVTVKQSAYVAQILFSDNFDWATAGSFDVTAGAGNPGAIYNASWYSITGTSAISKYFLRGYPCGGCLLFGSGAAAGRIQLPAITELGTTPTNIILKFKALSYMEYGEQLQIIVQKGTSTTGTVKVADNVNIGTAWSQNPFQGWYEVSCLVPNVTSANRISIQGVNMASKRWLIDDVVITTDDGTVKETTSVGSVVKAMALPQGSKISINAEDKSAVVVVRHNVDYTVSFNADWIKSYSASQKQSFDNGEDANVTFVVDENTGSERMADITFTNSLDGTQKTITLVQGPASSAISASFPVIWSIVDSKTTTANCPKWVSDGIANADSPNSFCEAKWCSTETTPTFIISSDGLGHLAIRQIWTDDYMLFNLPVKNFQAGTKVKIDMALRGVSEAPRYWVLEYCDGGVWKTASDLQEFSYTLSESDSNPTKFSAHIALTDTANATDLIRTVTFSNAVTDGSLQFRVKCVDGRCWVNESKDNATFHTSATLRLMGSSSGANGIKFTIEQ